MKKENPEGLIRCPERMGLAASASSPAAATQFSARSWAKSMLRGLRE